MKTIKFTSLFSVALFFLFSCNKENSSNFTTSKNGSTVNHEKMIGASKVKVKFKHTAEPTIQVPQDVKNHLEYVSFLEINLSMIIMFLPNMKD